MCGEAMGKASQSSRTYQRTNEARGAFVRGLLDGCNENASVAPWLQVFVPGAMVFCFCPSTPPEKVKATGGHGARDTMLLNMKEKPHQFGIGLKDSCCADPCCCLLSSCGAPCGFTACTRGSVLPMRAFRDRPFSPRIA